MNLQDPIAPLNLLCRWVPDASHLLPLSPATFIKTFFPSNSAIMYETTLHKTTYPNDPFESFVFQEINLAKLVQNVVGEGGCCTINLRRNNESADEADKAGS